MKFCFIFTIFYHHIRFMKKLLLAASVLFGTLAVTSCNNGDYDANPNTNNSNVLNPINPDNANSRFDWSGTDPMSAKIDGTQWKASSAQFLALGGYMQVMGTFHPSGTAGDDQIITLSVTSSAPGIYTLNATTPGSWTPKASNTANGTYSTALGSGGLKIFEDDASHIKGVFYFTAKTTAGNSVTVTEGYFNINK